MDSLMRIWQKAVDSVVALCLLIFFLPLIVFPAIAICVTSLAPLFVAEQGVSLDGSCFSYYCFRLWHHSQKYVPLKTSTSEVQPIQFTLMKT